jgi:dolichol-phosphate mannosyltransferase
MISIVIPTKNEEATIGDVIDAVKPYCDEVVVVDGHSIDKTRDVSQKHGATFVLDSGKGKGAGIKTGIKNASGDVIVFIDADGSHEPSDIPKLVLPILDKKADMVVGCRMTGGSDELHGDIGKFMRFIGSMIITLIINYRWNIRLTDVQNGFRALSRETAKNLILSENDFTIEEEMVMKCLRQGFRVINVPAHEYARRYGKSKIVLRKVWFGFGWVVIKNILGLPLPNRKKFLTAE